MARILIVDDSQTQIAAMTPVLESCGHEVITASDGDSGVKLALAEKPDLVLMDVVMPGNVNGFQATRQISHNPETKHIPVVIISTKDQETDKVWGNRQGAQDYLVKPFDDEELIAVIDKLLK